MAKQKSVDEKINESMASLTSQLQNQAKVQAEVTEAMTPKVDVKTPEVFVNISKSGDSFKVSPVNATPDFLKSNPVLTSPDFSTSNLAQALLSPPNYLTLKTSPTSAPNVLPTNLGENLLATKAQYTNDLENLDKKLSAGSLVINTNFENDFQKALAWMAAGITQEAYEKAAELKAGARDAPAFDEDYSLLAYLPNLSSNPDLPLSQGMADSLDAIKAANSIFENDFSDALFTNLAATLGYTKEDLSVATTSDSAISAFKSNKSSDTYKAMMDARNAEIEARKVQIEKTTAAYKEMKSGLDEKYDNKGFLREYNALESNGDLSESEKEQEIEKLRTKYNRGEYESLLKNIQDPLKEAKKELRKEKWGYFLDSFRATGLATKMEEFRKKVEAGEAEWFEGVNAFSFNAGSLRNDITFKKDESWSSFFGKMGSNLKSYWHEAGQEVWNDVVDSIIPSWKKGLSKSSSKSSDSSSVEEVITNWTVSPNPPEIKNSVEKNYGQPGLNDFWYAANSLIYKGIEKDEKEANRKALKGNNGEIDKKDEESKKWESVVNPSLIFSNLLRDQLISQYQFNMFFIDSKDSIDNVTDKELAAASLVSYRVKGMSIPEYSRPIQKQNFGNMQLSLMVNRIPTAEFRSTWEFTCDRELNIFENILAQTGSGTKVFKNGENLKYFNGEVVKDKMTDYTAKCESLWDLSTGPTSRLSDGYSTEKLGIGSRESGSVLILKVISAKELSNDYVLDMSVRPSGNYDLNLPIFIFEGFKILTMDYNLDFVPGDSENCLNIKSEVSWKRMYIRRDKTYGMEEGASNGKYYKPFTTLNMADISEPIKKEIQGEFNMGFPTLY